MKCRPMLASAAIMLLAGLAAAGDKSDDKYTDTFGESKADLVSSGVNPYFNLTPGWVATYAGDENGEKAELVITVTGETKVVDGVETRVVEERESSGGKLREVSRNYFAISKRTNSVYYFGEDSRTYKDEKETGHEGSWEAGKDGARYGLFMPRTVLLGSRFYQEVAPKKAMDRAEVVSLDAKHKTKSAEYKECVKILETSPLEPKSKEYKLYAPGVGLVQDDELDLVQAGPKGAAPGAAEKAAKK